MSIAFYSNKHEKKKKINSPIFCHYPSQFITLHWSDGDERELVMRANVDGRFFLRAPPSLFISTLCLCIHVVEQETAPGLRVYS